MHAFLARVTIEAEECMMTPSVTVNIGDRTLGCFRPPAADASVFGLLRVSKENTFYAEHILCRTLDIQNA